MLRVRVHCICCVAAVGENDVPIRWLVVVGDVLLHRVLLLHTSDDLSARSVHEIHHLPRYLATQRLLLWRAPAALWRSVQLLLAALVATGAPLRIDLVLRRRKDLLLVLVVYDVIIGLLLHELRALLLERRPPNILLHVVVEARRVGAAAGWILLLHLLKLLMRHGLVALIVIRWLQLLRAALAFGL